MKVPETNDERINRAKLILNNNKHSLKSFSSCMHVEKTLVDQNDIEEYIELLKDQYKEFPFNEKQKLISITNLQLNSTNNFKISFEKQDEFKIYLFSVSRSQTQFSITTCSYNEAIKLTNISSWWRKHFGDDHKSVLKELEEIFPDKRELLGFLINKNLEIE